MAAGEARAAAARAPGRYQILNKAGQPHWETVWAGNPDIARPGDDHVGTINAYVNNVRPYIESATKHRYTFRAYAPTPARIELTPAARALGDRYAGVVIFNPTIKAGAPINKDWGFRNWLELVSRANDVPWLQIGEPGSRRIAAVPFVETRSFIEACGILSRARAVVVHEGGLHHAAAAFAVPTVVIRGGFISPRVTGYSGQTDLYVEDERYPFGCGFRVPCPHCKVAMARIRPADVMHAVRALLVEPVAA